MDIALAMGLEDYYEHGVARGVVRYARERGGWRLFGQGWMFSSLEDLSRWRGDGVIARIESEQDADRLAGLGVPVVDVANAYRRDGITHVANHDVETGRRAGNYLLSLGFGSFAWAGVYGVRWSSEREQGFVSVCGEPAARFLRPLAWYEGTEGSVELRRFLEELPKPAALFAANDTVALRAAAACREAGIAVPGELALLGVDNEDIPCEMATPPLSSVAVRLEEIGYTAAATLERRIEGGMVPLMNRVESGELVERESSKIVAYSDPLVAEAVRLIRSEGPSIRSVGELTGRLNASRRSLELHFRRETGRTPHEELIRSRIAFACRLLSRGGEKVTTVAARSGFSSVQRFYAVFKAHTGHTPQEYRRRGRR